MVKLNKIYTRTGDDGTSGLADGSRIAKYDSRMQAIGDVDECNCTIGLAISAIQTEYPQHSNVLASLRAIQNDLFDLGADIATPGDDFTPSEMVLRIIDERIIWLENLIDETNADLQPLNSFILPGGSASASALHLARAITRRAERSITAAHNEHGVNPAAMAYINRLSDLLFTLCRSMNNGGADDILWVPGGSR